MYKESVLVSFLLLKQMVDVINFKSKKAYFGSQFWRLQSIVSWTQSFKHYVEVVNYNGSIQFYSN